MAKVKITANIQYHRTRVVEIPDDELHYYFDEWGGIKEDMVSMNFFDDDIPGDAKHVEFDVVEFDH